MRLNKVASNKSVCQLVRRNKYFLIGCLIGIILSCIFMPIFEDCQNQDTAAANKARLKTFEPLWFKVKYSSEKDYQLFVKLKQWYDHVRNTDYRPVIVNASAFNNFEEESELTKVNLQLIQHDNTLVRDKKLKFYRPRFHINELKIRIRFLYCILISKQFLSESLGQRLPNQTKSEFFRQLLGNYMNLVNQNVLKEFAEDILYFYPEISSKYDNGAISTINLMVSSNQGKSLEVIENEPNQAKHVQMYNYLISKNKLNEYSFVFMITERTFVSVENFLNFTQQFIPSDYILSTSNGYPAKDKAQMQSFFEENLGKNDSILNYGLLFSASLASKCQHDFSCFIRTSVAEWPSDSSANLYWNSSHHLDLQKPTSSSRETIAEIQHNKERIINAITLFPVVYGSEQFNLTNSLLAYYRIGRLKWETNQIEDYIKLFANDEDKNKPNQENLINWPFGVFDYQKARNRFEVSQWIYWNTTHILMPTDLQVVRPLNSQELYELGEIKSFCYDWANTTRPSHLRHNQIRISNIYRKFDAVRGLEYLVDFQYKQPTLENKSIVKNVRLQILKPLNPVEFMADVPFVSENIRVTLVLPVRGGLEVPLAIKFLNNYANICLKKDNHQTILIITLIHPRLSDKTNSTKPENDEFERLKKVSLHIQTNNNFKSVKIIFLDIHPPGGQLSATVPKSAYPSELVYLDLIARSLSSTSSEPFLMLHCRSNMLFSLEFLNRVRLNTIRHKQYFLPIPFIEYRLRTSLSNSYFQQTLHRNSQSPANNQFISSIVQLMNKAKSSHFDVRKDNGYFDDTNYEYVSFYLSDYIMARKESETLIPIARNQQSIAKHQNLYYRAKLDLFRLFLRQKFSTTNPLTYMRCVEPELKIFHSPILDNCDHFESNIYSHQTCHHRQKYGLAPKQKLASIVLEHLEMKKNDQTL